MQARGILRWSKMVVALLCIETLLLSSCLNRDLKPLTPCTTSGVVENVKVDQVEKVDMMFVVDGSPSMLDEITLLAEQLPRLVEVLTTGDTNKDGVQDFPPVRDLRLAVNTVDLGTLGAEKNPATRMDEDSNCYINDQTGQTSFPRTVVIDGINMGEDGVFWNRPNKFKRGTTPVYPECEKYADEGPLYLQFQPPNTKNQTEIIQAAAPVIEEFGCRQKLIFKKDPAGSSAPSNVGGRTSCGYEQQLESMFKAAWPQDDTSFTFFRGTGHAGGANTDFFREDSLWVMLMVTDEEDCSAYQNNPLDLGADAATRRGGPFYGGQPDNEVLCLRAAQDEEAMKSSPLHPIQRYVDGLLKLRPDPGLLVFAAITGLPIGDNGEPLPLYTDALNIDFDGILKHPSMAYGEEFLCPKGSIGCTDSEKKWWAKPACRIGDREVATAEAAPGRRYVRLAKQLEEQGANGVVYPICADVRPTTPVEKRGFTPAINAVVQKVADSLGAVCLPRARDVGEDGLVNCDVLETLPPPLAGSDRPTTCAELADRGRDPTPVEKIPVTVNGQNLVREVCRIRQLPKSAGIETKSCSSSGENCGWFYDDFTAAVKETCLRSASRETSQRIAFTEGSKSGAGSLVRFECVERIQAVPNIGQGLGASCEPQGSGPKCDEPYFCEPRSKSCQKECATPADCPDGYVCNTELSTPLCISPTCS